VLTVASWTPFQPNIWHIQPNFTVHASSFFSFQVNTLPKEQVTITFQCTKYLHKMPQINKFFGCFVYSFEIICREAKTRYEQFQLKRNETPWILLSRMQYPDIQYLKAVALHYDHQTWYMHSGTTHKHKSVV